MSTHINYPHWRGEACCFCAVSFFPDRRRVSRILSQDWIQSWRCGRVAGIRNLLHSASTMECDIHSVAQQAIVWWTEFSYLWPTAAAIKNFCKLTAMATNFGNKFPCFSTLSCPLNFRHFWLLLLPQPLCRHITGLKKFTSSSYTI